LHCVGILLRGLLLTIVINQEELRAVRGARGAEAASVPAIVSGPKMAAGPRSSVAEHSPDDPQPSLNKLLE